VWKKACEEGLVGVFIPLEYGGQGLGFLELALISEQLSRIDMGVGLSILAATFGSENILFFGSEEQKKRYLPLLTSGQAISAGAYTEPDAGSDVAGIQSSAIKQGDEFVLNGTKMFITHGQSCNWMVVLCATHPNEEKRHRRQSMILVESDRKGVEANKLKGKMGIRASETTEISFSNVHVPCENLIGEEQNGFYQLMHFFDITRTMVAAQGVGLAQGAMDAVLEYFDGKADGSKTPLDDQRIQFELAEMATKVELARTITYKAAWHVDRGWTDPSLNAMAKYFSGETAVRVCGAALQLCTQFGPEAFYDEFDLQKFYRDAKILEIYEGTKEVEKITIARRLR
jgi:alkylation response protein AidB-like acyl-CoA dehydrogenase